MIIWNFIRGLFCGNKGNNNIIPEPKDYIKEEQLTQREYIKEEQQNEGEKKSIEDESSENSQENNERTKKKVERLPEDQFLCSKCSAIPEILNIKSNEGKISFNCHKHENEEISVNEYINSIKDSTYFYLNNKCKMCGGKPTGIKTKLIKVSLQS